MIDYNASLVQPLIARLNAALELTAGNPATLVYGVNNVPRNTVYQFTATTDVGEYAHATTAQNGLHREEIVPINGIAQINPVSVDGATAGAFTALVDVNIAFILPINRMRGTTLNSFVSEFRRLVDSTLQASQSTFAIDGTAIYQVGCQATLMQTGDREVRGSAGDSLEFTLYCTFTVVASGIFSDSIELTIDGERIYAQKVGFARKSVKELGVPANGSSQKSYQSSTLFTISFDLPARFSANPTSTMTNKSFNEKVDAFCFGNTNTPFSVSVKYPETITLSGTTTTVVSGTYTYTMAFDTVGVNGETGLGASHSITLMEV